MLLKLSENPCRPVYRPRKAGAAFKLWAPAEDSRSSSSKLWPRRVLQGTQTDYKQFLYKGKQRNSKWIKWHPNIFQRGLNQRGQNDTCVTASVFLTLSDTQLWPPPVGNGWSILPKHTTTETARVRARTGNLPITRRSANSWATITPLEKPKSQHIK